MIQSLEVEVISMFDGGYLPDPMMNSFLCN